MKVIIFIPTFIIFLFVFYKLVRDDHVFLRKNIKPEQLFDAVFIATITGVILAQFTFTKNNFFLSQGVIGSAIGLLLVSIYKKFQVGRIFDFFSLSLLTASPLGFLLAAVLSSKTEFNIYLFDAVIYLLLAIFFVKRMLPNIMNRKIKEGNMSTYIMIIFSFFSLSTSAYTVGVRRMSFLNVENITLILLLITSLALFVRQNLLRHNK